MLLPNEKGIAVMPNTRTVIGKNTADQDNRYVQRFSSFFYKAETVYEGYGNTGLEFSNRGYKIRKIFA